MRIATASLCSLLLATGLYARQGQPPPAAGACSNLAALSLPNTTITEAKAVDAGAFTPPGADGGGGGAQYRSLPAFCRVAATLKPSSDSDIKIEVWMPASGWNGKFQAVGNGAFNGNIAYPALARGVARGYATASTDTGHTGGSANFALGHPEKVVDFGWRAVHELAEVSKKVIAAHYSAAPRHSYWDGCSAGGRQALKAAQKFPADFDGIVAGAPGLDWTGRAAQAVRVEKTLTANPAARLLQADRQVLHRGVLEACDALDGAKDGLIENPTRCKFDPATVQCKSGEQSGCLSAAQVETARLIYSSVKNPKSGRDIAGLLPGSELGWTDTGWTASARNSGLECSASSSSGIRPGRSSSSTGMPTSPRLMMWITTSSMRWM